MTTSGVRDAEATQKRLLTAASAEFAQFGIAGARVDRIAAAAQSNKAQIYHYFGSKDGLFDAVFDGLVELVVSTTPMDADDLSGYAGALCDGYENHPEIARLATWYRLERGPAASLIDSVVGSNAIKVRAIADAQAAGRVTDAYGPEVLLGLILHTAAIWTAQTPEYDHLVRDLTADQRREIVVSSVLTLVSPGGGRQPRSPAARSGH